MYINECQLIYNGLDLSKYIFVDSITKYVSPKLKFQQANTSVGSYVQGYGYEPFVIRVNASILANKPHEIAQVRTIIAQALMSHTPKKLLLPDDTGIYYKALYIGGSEVGAFTQAPDITLEFFVPDPIAYGGHHKETVQPHGDGVTDDTILVGGTYPTKPIITFTVGKSGTSTEVVNTPVEMMNKTTGKRISLTGSFKSNQIIEIDCELERVTVSDFTMKKYPNGEEMIKTNTRDTAPDIESDFFDIKDGDILYHSPNIYKYTIEWNERYL